MTINLTSKMQDLISIKDIETFWDKEFQTEEFPPPRADDLKPIADMANASAQSGEKRTKAIYNAIYAWIEGK